MASSKTIFIIVFVEQIVLVMIVCAKLMHVPHEGRGKLIEIKLRKREYQNSKTMVTAQAALAKKNQGSWRFFSPESWSWYSNNPKKTYLENKVRVQQIWKF